MNPDGLSNFRRANQMASIREQLRDQYDFLNWIKENAGKNADREAKKIIIGKIRGRIAELQEKLTDDLEKPITEEWRHIYGNEMGEFGYYYAIFPDEGETDDELSEWFDSCIAYPPINSPYDCTGKRFTSMKHIRRTKAGIVVIHGWNLDI